jgi:hypothetical protein
VAICAERAVLFAEAKLQAHVCPSSYTLVIRSSESEYAEKYEHGMNRVACRRARLQDLCIVKDF